jgi:zinc protease
MRYLCLAISLMAILSGCSTPQTSTALPRGITLIDQQTSVPNKVMIPYSKYQLSNGLTLILSPDHSDPLVHVDVTYHVGSAREQQGYTGFAHFFEHMMFQGSKHVGDQQHFKLITEAGGDLNGTTNRDRTNYYETVPSNQLEKILWLESDRMGYLLDAVSQRKFEIQRDTVKNERAQNFDNRPYGLTWEKMGEAMFPRNHPYSWQTIGYVSDLDKVDVNDLKAFFLRWYGPNNAVLTIGGDINVEQTLAWVNKYFGDIPRGPDVNPMSKWPASLAQDRFVTYEDRIQQPMVVIGWPADFMGSKNEASMSALAQVLGGGSNSVLYQRLVKPQKAVDAGAFQDCSELACTFYVYAMSGAKEQGKLALLANELRDAVQTVFDKGVDPQRLEEISGMAQADAVFAVESVKGKVSQLAMNQTYYGEPDRLQTELNEITSVTPSSIHRAMQQFLIKKHSVTLSVVPQGKPELAVNTDTYKLPSITTKSHPKILDDQLQYRVTKESFDRSVMPAVASAVTNKMPVLYRHYFDNGIELLGTQTSETPTVLLQFQLPAGDRYVENGKEGLAELTASMVEEGPKNTTAEEVQSQLDKLGSTISLNVGSYSTEIVVSSLVKNLAATLAIVNQTLREPKFAEEDFSRIKKQMLEGVVYQHQDANWLASQASRQVLYGETSFSRVNDGTASSIASLTLQEVNDFYHQHYTPHGAQLVVVGDISESDVLQKLDGLSQWRGNSAPLYSPESVQTLHGRKIYLIDKPGSSQSVVRFVRQGLPFDATGEVYLTQLANFNLAGNFNSRMNQNLREDKGYTYGMSGYVASNREVGALIFSAPVRQDVTGATIVEMQKEMRNFSEHGMTDDELHFMRLAVGQQDALIYETPAQKAQLLSNILSYSLDVDYLDQRSDLVKSVNKNTLNQLARKWFDPTAYQIVVVGDAKKIKPQLEKLNLPIADLEIIR